MASVVQSEGAAAAAGVGTVDTSVHMYTDQIAFDHANGEGLDPSRVALCSNSHHVVWAACQAAGGVFNSEAFNAVVAKGLQAFEEGASPEGVRFVSVGGMGDAQIKEKLSEAGVLGIIGLKGDKPAATRVEADRVFFANLESEGATPRLFYAEGPLEGGVEVPGDGFLALHHKHLGEEFGQIAQVCGEEMLNEARSAYRAVHGEEDIQESGVMFEDNGWIVKHVLHQLVHAVNTQTSSDAGKVAMDAYCETSGDTFNPYTREGNVADFQAAIKHMLPVYANAYNIQMDEEPDDTGSEFSAGPASVGSHGAAVAPEQQQGEGGAVGGATVEGVARAATPEPSPRAESPTAAGAGESKEGEGEAGVSAGSRTPTPEPEVDGDEADSSAS